ncbi:MAG TPA: Nramp family divalent metal transporter [Terriglobales bacterium]|nr:Nramp family divalent metal transporter [Terriglobales bacterium]
MKWLRRWKTRILLLLAVMGPGFITASVDNEAGGIYTYSAAGAQFGYSLLWTVLPVLLALVVCQEICARMGAITGKGLSDLIREEYGFRITFFMMLAILAANFVNIVAEFAGVASSLELFGVPKLVSVPLAAAMVWLLIVKGSYKSVEKVFLIASFFYVSYIVAGVLAHPAWEHAAISLVKPPAWQELKQPAYLYMVVGIVGATIGPWMQFYLQSSIVEKGVTEREYPTSRLDVIVGGIFGVIVAGFIILACAATLHASGHRQIRDASDAAYALKPLVGQYAYILFSAGLLNASLFAACILPLSTAYTVCEGLGFESGVEKKFREAPVFYWLYTLLIVAGAGLVLIPNFPLVRTLVLSQVINGVALPLVLIFMLLLVNKPELMGRHVNSRFFNLVAWATTIVIIAFSLGLIWVS